MGKQKETHHTKGEAGCRIFGIILVLNKTILVFSITSFFRQFKGSFCPNISPQPPRFLSEFGAPVRPLRLFQGAFFLQEIVYAFFSAGCSTETNRNPPFVLRLSPSVMKAVGKQMRRGPPHHFWFDRVLVAKGTHRVFLLTQPGTRKPTNQEDTKKGF